MATILGVDPGSRVTGYGFLREESGKVRMLLSGTVRPAGNLDLPGRLHAIHRDLRALIAEHEPEVVAVETAFYHKNVRSALVLGHVRGVVLLANANLWGEAWLDFVRLGYAIMALDQERVVPVG